MTDNEHLKMTDREKTEKAKIKDQTSEAQAKIQDQEDTVRNITDKP